MVKNPRILVRRIEARRLLLTRMIHDGSSRSRVEKRACGAARPRGVREQYVEGASDEPARRRLVEAANPRLQQKCS